MKSGLMLGSLAAGASFVAGFENRAFWVVFGILFVAGLVQAWFATRTLRQLDRGTTSWAHAIADNYPRAEPVDFTDTLSVTRMFSRSRVR
jgi:hypothetical protein